MGCKRGCVDIYDSMPPSVTTALTHQVASLLLAETDSITLRYAHFPFFKNYLIIHNIFADSNSAISNMDQLIVVCLRWHLYQF